MRGSGRDILAQQWRLYLMGWRHRINTLEVVFDRTSSGVTERTVATAGVLLCWKEMRITVTQLFPITWFGLLLIERRHRGKAGGKPRSWKKNPVDRRVKGKKNTGHWRKRPMVKGRWVRNFQIDWTKQPSNRTLDNNNNNWNALQRTRKKNH